MSQCEMSDKAAEVQKHLGNLSDEELIEAAKVALDDLTAATLDQPGSEWHEACFAGAIIYATELQSRGLILATRH